MKPRWYKIALIINYRYVLPIVSRSQPTEPSPPHTSTRALGTSLKNCNLQTTKRDSLRNYISKNISLLTMLPFLMACVKTKIPSELYYLHSTQSFI